MNPENFFDDSMLPLGFTFAPTDVQLVRDYLLNRILNKKIPCTNYIHEVNIFGNDPDSVTASLPHAKGEEKWYFFTKCQETIKHRKAGNGYWKHTTTVYLIKDESGLIGSRRSYTFHIGKPPVGGSKSKKSNNADSHQSQKTEWYLDEYTVSKEYLELQYKNDGSKATDYILARVYKKVGSVPPPPPQSSLTGPVIQEVQPPQSSLTGPVIQEVQPVVASLPIMQQAPDNQPPLQYQHYQQQPFPLLDQQDQQFPLQLPPQPQQQPNALFNAEELATTQHQQVPLMYQQLQLQPQQQPNAPFNVPELSTTQYQQPVMYQQFPLLYQQNQQFPLQSPQQPQQQNALFNAATTQYRQQVPLMYQQLPLQSPPQPQQQPNAPFNVPELPTTQYQQQVMYQQLPLQSPPQPQQQPNSNAEELAAYQMQQFPLL